MVWIFFFIFPIFTVVCSMSYLSARELPVISFEICSKNCKMQSSASSCLCPYGTNQLPWMDFHEIWYFNIFKKSVKIQVSLKSNKHNWYFTWRPVCMYKVSCWIILRMRNVSEKKLWRYSKCTFYVQ